MKPRFPIAVFGGLALGMVEMWVMPIDWFVNVFAVTIGVSVVLAMINGLHAKARPLSKVQLWLAALLPFYFDRKATVPHDWDLWMFLFFASDLIGLFVGLGGWILFR